MGDLKFSEYIGEQLCLDMEIDLLDILKPIIAIIQVEYVAPAVFVRGFQAVDKKPVAIDIQIIFVDDVQVTGKLPSESHIDGRKGFVGLVCGQGIIITVYENIAPDTVQIIALLDLDVAQLLG
jgi:hypothetical protein